VYVDVAIHANSRMSASGTVGVLSGRAQDRLLQLQRALADELRSLHSQQSLLFGALQACDLSTQSSHLQDYLERINAVLNAVVRLRAFIGRHCGLASPPEQRETAWNWIESK
jgi:hypothetical protein